MGPTAGHVLGAASAAAKSHTFADLAEAIDDAFARWDRGHLHDFVLADDPGSRTGSRLGRPGELDDGSTALSRLERGEQFVYSFDLGDGRAHLCTVGDTWIDPAMSSASCLRRR